MYGFRNFNLQEHNFQTIRVRNCVGRTAQKATVRGLIKIRFSTSIVYKTFTLLVLMKKERAANATF